MNRLVRSPWRRPVFGGRDQQVSRKSLEKTSVCGVSAPSIHQIEVKKFSTQNTDHRGTPEKPGRTVTLHRDDSAVTWGRAFEIAGTPIEQQETLKYLEWREKQYDIREYVDVFAPPSAEIGGDGIPQQAMTGAEGISDPRALDRMAVQGCLVYIAGLNPTTNPNFLGPAPLESISLQIATSSGPSGPNRDYLFGLAGAMREMGVDDEELFDLEGMVIERINKAASTRD